jgi:membrane-associated phospholipid phosphatase
MGVADVCFAKKRGLAFRDIVRSQWVYFSLATAPAPRQTRASRLGPRSAEWPTVCFWIEARLNLLSTEPARGAPPRLPMNDPSPPAAHPLAPPANTGIRGRLRGFLSARLDPTGYLGVHLTIGLIVAALGLWLVGALLDAVLDNGTMVRWDIATDAAIHGLMTPMLVRIVLGATELGSPLAMGALLVAGAIALWIAKRRILLIGWVAAFVGGVAVDEVLKLAVRRSRPIYGASFLHGHSYSFPSGHAMGSIIGYGMLVWLIGQFWHPGRRWNLAIRVLAGLVILAVGLSRLFLGVHYPSDVLGGYAAGAVWMAICINGVDIARHRQIDRAHPASVAAGEQVQPTLP